MKKIVFIMAFLMVSSSFAALKVTAKSAKVNVRDKASTKDSSVVSSISSKNTYEVEETKKDEAGRTWYKISEGWVAAWVMQPVKTLSIHGDKNMSDDTSTGSDDAGVDDSSFNDDSNLDSDAGSSTSDDDNYGSSSDDDSSSE